MFFKGVDFEHYSQRSKRTPHKQEQFSGVARGPELLEYLLGCRRRRYWLLLIAGRRNEGKMNFRREDLLFILITLCEQIPRSAK